MQALGSQEVEAARRFRHLAHGRWQGCQPYSLAAFTPQEIFLVLISITD